MSFASAVVRTAVSAVLVAGVVVACSSDPAPGAAKTFCDNAKSAATKCKEPQPCDTALTAQCLTLEKAVSKTTAVAAKDCLESGVCGAATCLTRAQKSAKPADAHTQLATRYCAQCAADVPDCMTQFYASKSSLPGALVLPFADAIVTAVADACTVEAGACRASFSTCATDTIARTLGTVAPEIAECVSGAFRRDEEVVVPGGGVQVSACTAANCKGCCREDKCLEGKQPGACGTNAGACQTCSALQECTEQGQCREPCGANNCKGCCDDGNCIPGTATDKCGGEGAACIKCNKDNPDLVCSGQKCIDGSCKATCMTGCCTATGCQPGTLANACGTGAAACINCGYGRACGATTKACALDTNSLWDFYVSFAVTPQTNSEGNAWDPLNGAPDPFLKAFSSLGTASHAGETPIETDAFVSVFIETPLKGISAKELLNNTSFELWDDDFDFDDLIGGCRLPLTPAMFDGSLQSFTCQATPSTVAVELWFRVNPHQP